MDIPFRHLSEWEEDRHQLANAAENVLTFSKSHQRIDLWLDTGGTTIHLSFNPTVTCTASQPKLSADMGVHPIISAEGITEIRFFSPSDLTSEYVNYRAK